MRTCPYCYKEIDLLATRCPYCTSHVEPRSYISHRSSSNPQIDAGGYSIVIYGLIGCLISLLMVVDSYPEKIYYIFPFIGSIGFVVGGIVGILVDVRVVKIWRPEPETSVRKRVLVNISFGLMILGGMLINTIFGLNMGCYGLLITALVFIVVILY